MPKVQNRCPDLYGCSNCSDSYQSETWQWDCREVNGPPLGDVDKASFKHSDGTQHMNPPVWKANIKYIQDKQFNV